MKFVRKVCGAAVAAAIVLTLAACDRKPMERAGRAVDRTWDKIGDKLRDVWR